MDSAAKQVDELLDEVRVVLATSNELPKALLAELAAAWGEARSNDDSGLKQLLSSLEMTPDVLRLNSASDKMDNVDRLAVRDLATFNRNMSSEYEGGAVVSKVATVGRMAWEYPVFFGTNRARTDESGTKGGFSSLRSRSIAYGRCSVSIPATHRFSETGTSFLRRWLRNQFASDRLTLREVNLFGEREFWSQLTKQFAASPETLRQGLIYLHGYNTTFEEAAIRAAQIGFDLKVSGATAFFSWPSQGSLSAYPSDAAAIEGSETAITGFLADFARLSGADVIHLVAHSMGNRGLLRALQRLATDAEASAGVKFGQIFLAAPDVDRDLFLDLAHLYPRFSQRTTLYASDGDTAVAMSAWLHGAPRAGYFTSRSPITVATMERLDSIAVPFFDVDLLGHSYFAQAEGLLYDMYFLMRQDAMPSIRPRIHAVGQHWEMQR